MGHGPINRDNGDLAGFGGHLLIIYTYIWARAHIYMWPKWPKIAKIYAYMHISKIAQNTKKIAKTKKHIKTYENLIKNI